MSHDPRLFSPVFSIDVAADPRTVAAGTKIDANELIVGLLKQMVDGQQRQIKLLEEISHFVGLNHKQRQQELANWKEANPALAKNCRTAAESLTVIQNEFLNKLTDEAVEGHENMVESEYMLGEFVDRFGPRMAHLGGVLHMLSQLSAPKDAPAAAPAEES